MVNLQVYTFGDFLFNIFCNLFASFVLIIILFILFKPKIRAVPYITERIINGEKHYLFEIINPTFFTFRDAKISLNVLSYGPGRNGRMIVVKRESIALDNETITLPRKRLFGDKKLAYNKVLIKTDSNIRAILQNDLSVIELTVDLSHPLNLSAAPNGRFAIGFSNVYDIQVETITYSR